MAKNSSLGVIPLVISNGGTGASTLAGILSAFGPIMSSPYVVAAGGAYTTIQAAVNAAHAASGGIVIVQPGTYTENLTLYDAVHIMGMDFSDAGGGVNITGVHVPPDTGGFVFNNVALTSATHIFSSAVAGSAHLVIANAKISVTNGYTFNLVNWTGKLESFDVNAAVGTADGYVNNTGGAEVDIFECSVGSGTANPMITSGAVYAAGANIYCPVQFGSGSVVTMDYSEISASVTLAGTSTGLISSGRISSGASAAVTMSSSAAWQITNTTISSSNNPAIAGAGAGVLSLGGLVFTSNSSLAGTLTVTWLPTKTGAFTSGTAINAGTTITAGTTLTATLGAITATNGNLVLGTAGNKILSTSVGSTTSAGANSFGTVTLTGGTATVATTAVTASSIIILTRQTVGATGAAALGILSVGTITASTSFVINAWETTNATVLQASDVSSIGWMIIN